MVKEIAKIAIGQGKRLFSHLVISQMTVALRIGGTDAAVVAAQYGRACAVVYPAFAVLAGNTKCRRHHVSVAPDYLLPRKRRFTLWLKWESSLGLC